MKAEIPDTSNVTSGLVKNKLTRRSGWQGPLDDQARLPLTADYMADEDRLYIMSMSNSFVWTSVFAGMCFVLALPLLIMVILDLIEARHEFDYMSVMLICLVSLGVLLILTARYFAKLNYFIFNRMHGTVGFPSRFGQKSFTVPFNEVSCYTASYTTNFGGLHFDTLLYPHLKPRGWRSGVYKLPVGGNEREAAEHWALLCRYMNRQMPLPMVGATGEWIRFFKNNQARVEDLGTDRIPQKALDEFEERIDRLIEESER